jgi:hypothetical protein
VDSTAGLDAGEKKKLLTLQGIKPRFLGHPALAFNHCRWCHFCDGHVARGLPAETNFSMADCQWGSGNMSQQAAGRGNSAVSCQVLY